MPFEHPFGPLMTGTISHQVLDPHGIRPPSNIIQTGHPWGVKVDWQISGIAAPYIGGDWHLEVFAESIGPGPEMSLGTATVPLSAAPPPSPRNYSHTFTVGAGTLPAGTYRLVTLITWTIGPPPPHPGEMAAYDDKTIVQIYQFP